MYIIYIYIYKVFRVGDASNTNTNTTSKQLTDQYVDAWPLCTIMPRDYEYIIPFTFHSCQQKCAGTTPRTLETLVENSPHREAVSNAREATQ